MNIIKDINKLLIFIPEDYWTYKDNSKNKNINIKLKWLVIK
jgi:hypothetical protein